MDDKACTIRIEPDPPVAGQPAEIRYTGKGAEIDIYVDGKHFRTAKPDKDGKVRLQPVPVGREMIISDGFGFPGHLYTDIVELSAS